MSKRSVIQTNDGYLMLLDAVYFNGRRMGNISEEGLDWGGEDAQTVELWAAQIRTSPCWISKREPRRMRLPER